MICSLTLQVQDLKEARSFYKALGYDFLDMNPKGMGAKIHGCYATRSHDSLSLIIGEPSQVELGFFVKSYSDVKARLARRGYLPSLEHSPANPRGPFTFFDPDGRKIELHEIG